MAHVRLISFKLNYLALWNVRNQNEVLPFRLSGTRSFGLLRPLLSISYSLHAYFNVLQIKLCLFPTVPNYRVTCAQTAFFNIRTPSFFTRKRELNPWSLYFLWTVGANLFVLGVWLWSNSSTRQCRWSRHCRSISDGVIGIFHWYNPSDRTMVLGSNHPLSEMGTRNISCGVKAVGA
jgi:hypothetical protein